MPPVFYQIAPIIGPGESEISPGAECERKARRFRRQPLARAKALESRIPDESQERTGRMSAPRIDDIRIRETKDLVLPRDLLAEFPHRGTEDHIRGSREMIHRILTGGDDRLLVVVGPCSIHDPEAAVEYAGRLRKLREGLPNLMLVMRVYFEKPRTTVGWKGLINDPDLDGSFNINHGLRKARGLLLEINRLEVPCGTEYLDVISPQYFADLISWGAIGARTTESQVHRELASGLSCPIGFKNATDGNVKVAADAVYAASQQHHFLSVTKDGRSAISATSGNEDCHVILRGGGDRTNYGAEDIERTAHVLSKLGLPARIMVDCSHANSGKDYRRQPEVARQVALQVADGDTRIIGLMIESHLVEGRQDLDPATPLTFGQSITDSCIGWDATAEVLAGLDRSVTERRKSLAERRED